MHLGQEVGPGEGGPALGHGLHRHAGRVGQDAVGQISGVKQRQVVAVREASDPGASVALRRSARPVGARRRSSRPGCGAPWPAGSRGWPGAAGRAPRRWSVGGRERWRSRTTSTALRSSMAAERCENSAIRASETPVTSKRSCSECRRARPSQPHPSVGGQEVGEHALVQFGQGDQALEQTPRIERAPGAVGERAGPVGHHHVVVELGVAGPRVEVGEGGGDHAFDVFLDDAIGARARMEHLAFGVGEHDLDGPAMAGVDLRPWCPYRPAPRPPRPTWRARR